MNIRISEGHWQQVRGLTDLSFLSGIKYPPETGCILLVAHNDHFARPSLLVADVLPPEPGDFSRQASGALTFSSDFLRRALLCVRQRGLQGFITVHTHPFSDDVVCFSPYDDANDPDLMANLHELQPSGMFGSMVLGKRTACARLWLRGEPIYLDALIVTGEQLSVLSLNGAPTTPPADSAALFDRSAAITGNGALFWLSQLRVGLIGASGTGSLMNELLMRAGVGEIIIFEFDDADETNLNRVLHLRRQDAKAHVNKGERLAAVVAETSMPTTVTVVESGDIRDANVADELRGCDLVVGCVDRDWPRLILCEVAYQYLIPYIDLGTEIGACDTEIQSIDSRVSHVGPGRPCLFCSGVINAERIRLEGCEDEERSRIHSMGYSKDVDLKAPAVMDVNMRAASTAMLIIRHLLQPFLATPLPHSIKETVTNLNSKALRFQSSPTCIVCGSPTRLGSARRFPLTTRDCPSAA
jgi:molybdopterin-synthase adenylyltransferase